MVNLAGSIPELSLFLKLNFSGEKLKPFVVVKGTVTGTPIRKVNAEKRWHSQVEQTVQKNGFIDKYQMRKWIWKPFDVKNAKNM
jgi:hypothetical protein